MIVNFKIRGISRGARKLTQTLTLIKKYIYKVENKLRKWNKLSNMIPEL